MAQDDPADPDFVRHFTIGRTRHRVEYDFLALADLERATQRDFIDLARTLFGRRLPIDVAIELVRAGLNRGSRTERTREQVAAMYQGATRDERQAMTDAAAAAFAALFREEFAPKETPAGKEGPAPDAPAA